jgi:hypothetical protein
MPGRRRDGVRTASGRNYGRRSAEKRARRSILVGAGLWKSQALMLFGHTFLMLDQLLIGRDGDMISSKQSLAAYKTNNNTAARATHWRVA